MKADPEMFYLASKSPRRQELLNQIGVRYTLLDVPPQDNTQGDMIDETARPEEKAHEYVSRLACEKAECAWRFLLSRNLERHPVLTADTTVVIDSRILGKPTTRDEAIEMLCLLSGKTHQVMTGVAVRNEDGFLCHTVQVSDVTFSPLSFDSICAYTATAEPYDKAGGYGIQGRAGKFIQSIRGSYSGIMGLPLYETTGLLRKAGIFIP